jgi:hypothetical protein
MKKNRNNKTRKSKFDFKLGLVLVFGILVFLSSCSSKEPECFYIPAERVLFIDDYNYKFVGMQIIVYPRPDMEGKAEHINLHFKDDVSIQSIDFDNIDTTKLENIDVNGVKKIQEAKSIAILFIYINGVVESFSIDRIRRLNYIDKSKPVTKCDIVRK